MEAGLVFRLKLAGSKHSCLVLISTYIYTVYEICIHMSRCAVSSGPHLSNVRIQSNEVD